MDLMVRGAAARNRAAAVERSDLVREAAASALPLAAVERRAMDRVARSRVPGAIRGSLVRVQTRRRG